MLPRLLFVLHHRSHQLQGRPLLGHGGQAACQQEQQGGDWAGPRERSPKLRREGDDEF